MASVKLLPKNTSPTARKPWPLRYWDTTGQHERSFTTAGERKDFAVAFEHGHRAGAYVDPRDGNVTFRVYADRWLAMHAGKPATLAAYRTALNRHIYPAIGDTPLAKITRERLRNLLLTELPAKPTNRKGTLGYRAIAKCHLVLTAVLNEAIKERKIPVSPADDIDLPDAPGRTEMTIPLPGQIDLLADSMTKWSAMIALMAGCGLRLGEALAVRMPLEGATALRVTEQKRQDGSYGPLKHRKPGEFRDVPLPRWVAERITDTYTGPVGGYLWPQATDKRFRPVFTAAREAAGLPATFTPHSLRHVFASAALANGVPLTDVSRFLGHANVQITYGLYSHLVPTAVGSVRAVLDAWHDQ